LPVDVVAVVGAQTDGPATHHHEIDAVRHQPAGANVVLLNEHRRQAVLDGELPDADRMAE